MATTLGWTGAVFASGVLLASLTVAAVADSAAAEGSCSSWAERVAGDGGSVAAGEHTCGTDEHDVVPAVSLSGIFGALSGDGEGITYLGDVPGDGPTFTGGWLASSRLPSTMDIALAAASISLPGSLTTGPAASDGLSQAPIAHGDSGEQLADPGDDGTQASAPLGRRGGIGRNLKK